MAGAYDRDWAFALHAPYFDRVKYNGRDMYLGHTLKGLAARFNSSPMVSTLLLCVANSVTTLSTVS